MIIDSHCHLDYAHLYDQLDQVIKEQKIIMLSICLQFVLH